MTPPPMPPLPPSPAPAPGPGRFVSIGSKLALAIFIVLVLATAAIYTGLNRFAHERMIAAKEQAARMAGELFLRSASTPVLFDDATGILDTVALLAQDPEVLGVQLWRATGGQAGQDGQKTGEQIAARFKDRTGHGVPPRWVDAGSIERLADRLVLRDAIRDQDGKIIAVAAVQYSLIRENLAFADLRRQILLSAGCVGTLLGLLLWGVTRRWITGPIGRLVQAVKQVEAGERIELALAQPSDEIGRLAAAFGRMAEVVVRRERDIVHRNDDMKLIMDNVAQGLLNVTREGVLLPEHSAALETWFGPWRTGETLWTYLQATSTKAADLIEVLWSNVSEDFLPLELALEQMPARMEIGARTFALAYRPIPSGAEIRILIVISDVTLEIEQERAQVGQQELVSLAQWIVTDRPGLLAFFADADRLVHAITHGGDAVGDLPDLRRDLHTLKGNSGFFGLTSLVAVCQAIEDHFAEGAASLPAQDRDLLLQVWERVGQQQRQLLGDEPERRLEIEADEYHSLLGAIAQGALPAQIEMLLRTWTMKPAKQQLARLGRQARALARRLGKGDISVVTEANQVRLPDQALGEFWGTFAHVLRNAIDHGLETSEERQRAGKGPVGTIKLRTEIRAEQLFVEIEDDGRGIDWGRLGEKARAAGLPATTPDDLVEALFADGISTREAVSETSGRGVGMSAVRSTCHRTGGEVRVYSEPGQGTRFEFSWPVSILYGAPPLRAIQ